MQEEKYIPDNNIHLHSLIMTPSGAEGIATEATEATARWVEWMGQQHGGLCHRRFPTVNTGFFQP